MKKSKLKSGYPSGKTKKVKVSRGKHAGMKVKNVPFIPKHPNVTAKRRAAGYGIF